MPFDGFDRSVRVAEPCVCVDVGSDSVIEDMDGSVERSLVEFEDSRCE